MLCINALSNRSLVMSHWQCAHASEAPSHYYKTSTTDCRHIIVVQRTGNGAILFSRRTAVGRD